MMAGDDVADRLSGRSFQRLATLVEGEVGIRLPPTKQTMVEGRLRRRVRELGLPDLDAYCDLIFDGGANDDEMVHLVDAITTNKTDFFREPEHFQILATTVVPNILAMQDRAGPKRLKVWSAASSNGAEAYTLAMVLADLAPRMGRFSFAVLGTDICTTVLEQARKAIYPAEMMAPVPEEMRRRYVMRARASTRNEVRIVPELRARARFQHLNLMDRRYPVDTDVDVIFCRNVLIYFDKPRQAAVLNTLCSHLRPGGYLFLGHSETAAAQGLGGVRSVAPTVLRKMEA
ncbi:CheR family methyltransferase [Zavarzinia sp. CC-PAN008]|uniref:CheR family methyltransferase n=1 Tax=Zavarzinia sp. CC-PAN008 TaxID=3243332 RepID=UPI003F74A1EB